MKILEISEILKLWFRRPETRAFKIFKKFKIFKIYKNINIFAQIPGPEAGRPSKQSKADMQKKGKHTIETIDKLIICETSSR